MSVSEQTDVAAILRAWEEENGQPNYDPVPTLTRLCELIEMETENYYKMDPDPFDERHPSRADPVCGLGHMLKVLFRKDVFMTKLVNDYLRDTYWSRLGITGRDVDALNIAACRLMLDTMPGLETSAVFMPDMDGLINRLLKWSTKSKEPLQSYATGILASAMEVQEIAARYREQNGRLIPLMLQRLRKIQNGQENEEVEKKDEEMNTDISDECAVPKSSQRPFAHLSNHISDTDQNTISVNTSRNRGRFNSVMRSPAISYPQDKSPYNPNNRTPSKLDQLTSNILSDSSSKKRFRFDVHSNNQTPASNSVTNKSPGSGGVSSGHLDITESSNSSWVELESYVIGNVQMYPPTDSTRQILILKYLTPMGEYQEFLSHMFEHNALSLILNYVNVKETKDSRLAFEALKYLAALLCHKKFSIEFINVSGLQRLLEVPRPSVAATGVSICIYYLSYCEDAMERVCMLPENVVKHLVKYALWMLECSHHDSGRCHAIMFFGLTFQFKCILDAFDEQDGLRMFYNVISTLPILSSDEEHSTLSDDVICAARQIVRHVCVALKRYLEAHLYIRSEQLKRSIIQLVPYKAMCKTNSPEDVQERVDILLEQMPFRAHWPPVDELLRLGAISLLLQIIAFAYEWNYGGRAETVRSALDVLAICAVMPRVQLLFGERVELVEDSVTVGINIILSATEGEIVADPEVQKAALSVIVNCVCAPINRVGGSCPRIMNGGTSPRKRPALRTSEDLIQKVWENVRSQNGIMVFLQLMQVETPITDADCIRTLACRALAGLARSDTVKQIISKLPLFTNGQLQNLMRDPILQEKRQEHVRFQKYALELMQRVSGNTKPGTREMDVSLANIHRANIVAQTKIQYNDKQLLQLIHQHLHARGLSETAGVLQREAQLTSILPLPSTITGSVLPMGKSLTSTIAGSAFSPLRYTTPTTQRSRLPFTPSHYHQRGSTPVSTPTSMQPPPEPGTVVENVQISNTPIKITKKINSSSTINNSPMLSTTPNVSRLEKQISFTGDHNVHAVTSTSSLSTGGLALGDDIATPPRVTLDSIITEYLTNQHALCKNPMATCPQFNLFMPHKCPDPKPQLASYHNFTMRLAKRAMGFNARMFDRRLIHSRFCPVQTIRLDDDEGGFYTCSQFMPCGQKLIIGTFSGEVKLFNIHTGNEEASVQCHESLISAVQPNRQGNLLLTSSSWRTPLSALWSCSNNYFEMILPLNEEEYVEFSNLTQDKIIGTKNEVATIYDIATLKLLYSLEPSNNNQYTKNKATFSPTDELILSDGVLWDANSNVQIHKFDKLNQTQSGLFHPNGLEVVSNTEVWDLRTFHLLRTVPALNHSQVFFNNAGDIIYSVGLEHETEEDTQFDSSFKTLDASDYTSIATIDVKKNIYHLSVDKFDTQIALVENQGRFESIQESVVRLYDVGRRRDYEDEQDEEEDDEDMENSEDGSGSGSQSGSESESDANVRLLDAVVAVSARNRRRRHRRNRRRRNTATEAENNANDAENGDANEEGGDEDDNDDENDNGDDWVDLSSEDDDDEELDMGAFSESNSMDSDQYSIDE